MKLNEIAEAKQPTPGNVDGSFTIGKVAFDNEKGLGATPNGQNILYRGAVAFIKPSTFRKLALPADRTETGSSIIEKINNGNAIAVPWLDIDVIGDPSNPTEVVVVGHEGRARTDAFKALNGDAYMPVQLQLRGIRAHHLSTEFFDWIEENGLTAEQSTVKVKPAAEKYFWNGEKIQPK